MLHPIHPVILTLLILQIVCSWPVCERIFLITYTIYTASKFHLVAPLVSRGNELNLVVISVAVNVFCLPNVGIVLCGTAATP